MTDNKTNKSQKVVSIDGQRSKKQARKSIVTLLQDSRAAAQAMKDKTCFMCHSKKPCVNKTGLCAACYGTLNPEGKKVADSEAAHKIITVTVSDDRWTGDGK